MNYFPYVFKFYSKTIATAVKALCQRQMKDSTNETNVDWLFVLPLYHFMDGKSEPFMPPEYDPEKILFYTELMDRSWKLPKGLVSKLTKNLYAFQ